MKVACIIPTLNGANELASLIDSLLEQTQKLDIYIVDSSSTDETLAIAADRIGKDKIVLISKASFDHGGTRQMMFEKFPDYDFYVYLTQDVLIEERGAIKLLLQYFDDINVAAVCGRQLPHRGATPFASHARLYNYPELTQIKSLADIASQGIKAAFLSNSYAAYRATSLRDVGGFPSNTIFAEDMYVAAKMILSGRHIVYAADAKCLHSHNYSVLEEFSRYFDMGVFHAHNQWIRAKFGGAGGEGLRYVKSELKYLGFKHFYLWPASIIRNGLKLLGYKLGMHECWLPFWLKRHLGANKSYWHRNNLRRSN